MIATPALAITVEPWSDLDGQPVRYWTGQTWEVDGVEIAIVGTQSVDGTTTQRVVIGEHEFDVEALSEILRAVESAMVPTLSAA